MRHTLALVVAALLSAGIRAADPVPQLTDANKLLLQNRLLAYRVSQLELDAVVRDLTVPGYVINLQTLAYEKAPEKDKP